MKTVKGLYTQVVKRHQIRTEAALSPAQLPNVSEVKTSLLSRFCLESKSLGFDSEVMWRYNLFALSPNFHHLGTATTNTTCQLKKK